jgi:hypothetical protein
MAPRRLLPWSYLISSGSGTSAHSLVPPQPANVTSEDRNNPLSGLKVAIQMTTHLSKQHQAFLTRCWPAATQRLTLLKHSDLILFTSLNSSHLDEWLRPLEFTNKTVRHYVGDERDPYHGGAKLGLVDPLEKGYLDAYDWVIRLNPDVLIRNDTWLLTALVDPDIDGVFSWCSIPSKLLPKNDVMALQLPRAAVLDSNQTFLDGETSLIHTDFMAFRPRAVVMDTRDSARQYAKEIRNTEIHATKVMAPIISSGRHVQLFKGVCNRYLMRIVGRESPVVHAHNLLDSCPDYFDAHGEDASGGLY